MQSSKFLNCVVFTLFILRGMATCPDSLQMIIGSRTITNSGEPQSGEGVTFLAFENGSLLERAVLNTSVVGENPSFIAYSKPFFFFGDVSTPSVIRELKVSKNMRRTTSRAVTGQERSGAHVSVVKRRIGKGTGRQTKTQKPSIRRIIVSADYGGSSVSTYMRTKESFESADVFNVPLELAAKTRDPSLPFQQSAPHPHMVLPYKDGVLVPDLGADLLFYLEISEDGLLSERSRLAFVPGDGPRHAALHPNSETVYVVNEISLSVVVIRPTDMDQFTFIDRAELLSTIPADEKIKAAAIRVSNDGKFLYVSVRYLTSLTGSIVAYSLDPSTGDIVGRLGEWSTHGGHPRDFVVIDDIFLNGKCSSAVAVANRDGENVVLVERDIETGELAREPTASIAVSSPLSVLVYN